MNKLLLIIVLLSAFSINLFSQENQENINSKLLDYISPKMCGVLSEEEIGRRKLSLLDIRRDSGGVYLSAINVMLEELISDSIAQEYRRNFNKDKVFNEYIDLGSLSNEQFNSLKKIHLEELTSVIYLLSRINTNESNSLLVKHLIRFDKLFGDMRDRKYLSRTINQIYESFLGGLSKVSYYDEGVVSLCYSEILSVEKYKPYARYLRYLEANMKKHPEIKTKTKNILKDQEFAPDPHSSSLQFRHYFRQE